MASDFSHLRYCTSLTKYTRFETREVRIGDLLMGGNNPIRVQSMTTTDTMDTAATVAQSIRMIKAGCELVRITAPSLKEAQNLALIKSELRRAGFNTPLVADIHFTPNAAELAARIVEKVRVNPGNYADKKRFETIDYTDAAYEAELERIRERFVPLVRICKEYGTAMRIGTNHGSLSDRIMSRYGDSPLGMVESALEFIRIAEAENFHNIVLSMKASNTQVMVQAYRMLVNRMMQENMNYPLHLGVTEAGEGEDGRIKSAVGIGTLLEDGLGDTIRVSLTEEPEFEIPVARALAERYSNRNAQKSIPEVAAWPVHPFEHQRRASRSEENVGGKSVPVVVSDFRFEKPEKPSYLYRVGYQYVQESDKWNIQDQACDYVYTGDAAVDFEIPGTLGIIQNAAVWDDKKVRTYPLFTTSEALSGNFKVSAKLNFLLHDAADFSEALFRLLKETNWVLVLKSSNVHAMPELRRFVVEVMQRGIDCPILVYRDYTNESDDAFQLYAATDCGALLNDGLVDGIWLQRGNIKGNQKFINQTAFGILQAARARISKTEYISCPSCGRTLFDLQETTAKIRKRTDHLKGLKIGIMGCIVNGPGEMADADFGYVGTGVGKITLYKGREVVKRNVDSEHAVDELIGLIKENNCWVEPSAE
ncbi:MAG: (E)-4-hydroxy-3-methylbut-2-enyl-diphosphate synthase [Bacteroidia bacterium]|jgi:(E)-4-hydroxy-3-methylbut-2-enyl-diphosphate synthase